VKRQVSETPEKPALDESAFQQLLSAAYVLQQHKEQQQGKEAESSFSKVLNQVLDIQEHIRHGKLDLQAAATLVAKRAREFTEASGAAVGILEGGDLEYYAATGSASGELGSRGPADLSLSSECLASATVLRSSDTENDLRLRPDLCRPLGIRALIAAPILFEASVHGVLELHFVRATAMREQDVRVAELLASLLSEAVGKEKERAPDVPQSAFRPSAEDDLDADSEDDRGAMLEALEKIKPQLQRLAGAAASTGENACESCGHVQSGNDPFCGECGAPRRTKTWSSIWEMQREAEKSGAPLSSLEEDASGHGSMDVLPSELEDIVAHISAEGEPSRPTGSPAAAPHFSADASQVVKPRTNGNGAYAKSALEAAAPYQDPFAARPAASQQTNVFTESASIFPTSDDEAARPAATVENAGAITSIAHESPWESAAKAKAWFETENRESGLAATWRRHRGNVYLAAAAGLLVTVLFVFDAPEAPSNAAVSRPVAAKKGSVQKASPAPELSTSDKLLIGLGLAEAPEAPVYKGNPDTKVWVDVHTALYYCPGASLYGKSNGGRVTTQRDAQQDSFQPASRRACD
jgi:hypothetical protein